MIAFGRMLLANWRLWLIVALVATVGLQQVRLANRGAELATERQARATETSDRNRAALRESERVATLQLTHAAQQQETVHAFEQTIRTVEAGRAGDAARTERVRLQFAATAARDRVAARSDPAACERVADRSEVIAAAAAEGGELLAEARRALARRDAEVSLLLGIVRNDRALLAPD
ncbi:hypothetical protein [Variovorax sp. UMC13]|uniref:hypothetical protein n=1 Tax=Variovorax sp. UMC13 TaxID=1862326 RepID=UPI00160433AD|nr:hypothetical protein [Variovorax sp. UMC13]MBB1599987.1 hypothetical protein [Variovorax sp. UMC13]